MPALPSRLRLPLVRRFQTSITTITDRSAPSLLKAWDDLGSYDEADIPTLAARSARTTAAIKGASFVAATGFYSVLSGRPRPAGMTTDGINVDAEFRGPFIAVWRAFKEGRPENEALAAGRSRIEALASNLANSAARQTGDLFVSKAGIHTDGWERVTDPGACQWCHDVANSIYHSADAADFGHDRCGCTAVPRI